MLFTEQLAAIENILLIAKRNEKKNLINHAEILYGMLSYKIEAQSF